MDKSKIKGKLKKERAESKFYNGPEIEFNINDLADSTFKSLLLELDKTAGSPSEYFLTALLASLAGTIGKKAYFGPDKYRIYLNIYALIIGPSSYMYKSTAIRNATSDLQQIQKMLHEKYSSEFEKWQESNQGNDDKKKTPKTPAPRKEYVILPVDATPEKVADILQTQQRGLTTFNEFAGWLKRLQGTHQLGAKELYTELYDNPESYSIARKTAEKDVHIETPVISIVGASTIEWLQDTLHKSDQASGFLARFIVSIRNRNDKPYVPVSYTHLTLPTSDLV